MSMRSGNVRAVFVLVCGISVVAFAGGAEAAEPEAAASGGPTLSISSGSQLVLQTAGDKSQAPQRQEPKANAEKPPRELAMRPLPSYRIQPPDLIQVEMLKMIPLPPYRVVVYDVLQIQVMGTLSDQPIDGFFLVAAEGAIDLGPAYGTIRVVGMTIKDIIKAVTEHLKEVLNKPDVSVQLGRTSSTQPVTGTYLVGPDGTINLRQYGSVLVSGKTLGEARLAIQEQLGQYFASPEVTVDITGYNSKVYYIVTEGAGTGDNVTRVPITGSETVLDAICQIGGLSQLSSKKIWIARPSASDPQQGTILPVDWDAITHRGATATNYQIMPGDRVFIAQDCAIALNNWLSKVYAPAERTLGILGLTKSVFCPGQ
jgi:polysaccharide export outer membrane protein